MQSNTTASDNNAMGYIALTANTTGTFNNAVGNFSLDHNTAGNNNNAVGYAAMIYNTTGSNNSAQGFWALANNTTGSNNIAIGQYAGYNQTTGSNNIYFGPRGVAAENGVIRIGTPGTQKQAYIAGVSGTVVTGGTVVVTSSGQLGVASSSRRYKQDIERMGDTSERLYRLRPVKFRYIKTDEQGKRPVQFGLIAEEVADVLPELVYRDADGRVEGVRYDELAPMLLNEIQHQKRAAAAQAVKMASEDAEIIQLRRQLAVMQAALDKLQRKKELVAQR
jgi:hypothetical protein